MTYPPGIMSSFVVCENYVSELCTLTYERTVPFSPMFTTLSRDIPKIIKFKATNSLRVSCLFCIFKHSPQKTV